MKYFAFAPPGLQQPSIAGAAVPTSGLEVSVGVAVDVARAGWAVRAAPDPEADIIGVDELVGALAQKEG